MQHFISCSNTIKHNQQGSQVQCKLKVILEIVLQEKKCYQVEFNGGQCHRNNLPNSSIICALVPVIINPMHRSHRALSRKHIKCWLTMLFRPAVKFRFGSNMYKPCSIFNSCKDETSCQHFSEHIVSSFKSFIFSAIMFEAEKVTLE